MSDTSKSLHLVSPYLTRNLPYNFLVRSGEFRVFPVTIW